MGRKRKPSTYSCYDAPFNPNQTSDSEDETPDKPGELKFGTILNNAHLLTFPLQFSSLMLRSFNEFSRTKGMERAI